MIILRQASHEFDQAMCGTDVCKDTFDDHIPQAFVWLGGLGGASWKWPLSLEHCVGWVGSQARPLFWG